MIKESSSLIRQETQAATLNLKCLLQILLSFDHNLYEKVYDINYFLPEILLID